MVHHLPSLSVILNAILTEVAAASICMLCIHGSCLSSESYKLAPCHGSPTQTACTLQTLPSAGLPATSLCSLPRTLQLHATIPTSLQCPQLSTLIHSTNEATTQTHTKTSLSKQQVSHVFGNYSTMKAAVNAEWCIWQGGCTPMPALLLTPITAAWHALQTSACRSPPLHQ